MLQQTCPGCGGDNCCEVARTGRSDMKCWCMEVTMPASLAHPITGTACLCRECATGNEKAPASTGAFPAIER